LQSGVQPDILVCRSERKIPLEVRSKVARFCNVSIDAVIENINASTIYEVPFLLHKEKLDKVALKKLQLTYRQKPDFSYWKNFVNRLKNPSDDVHIGLVGKYVELHDAYLSIAESLIIAGSEKELEVNIHWIHSEDLTEVNCSRLLGHLDGVLVAPGFGERGIEGKIDAVKYVRENNIPFYGICLGMQMAVIEYGRNVMGIKDANSTEFSPDTSNPVISLMEEQKKVNQLGGTMRLGAYSCTLKKGSLANKAYRSQKIAERHRHRYEFNSEYQEIFEKSGMLMSGINPETKLVEIIEIPAHRYFIGTQFHPEYKSTVESPHPLFLSFVEAAYQYKVEKVKKGEEQKPESA